MKKQKDIIELLIIIIVLAFGFFLYTFKLGEIPSGLYVDEASTGYNSYSILQTGKDEYGKSMPVAFRFLGSYTPPLYTYLSVPIIAVAGLNVTSVRFLSALCGVLNILIIFLLVKSLNLFKFRRTPVIGAFLFSILPWNVFFARIGYEMNLALTIFSAGILALWLGLKKPWFIVFGFTLLSLSTYAAHTQLYLAPIFIIVFGAVFREVLFGKSHLKLTLTGIAIAVVLQIPHFFLLATPAFWNKTDLFYKSSSFFREFLSQFFTYFSPRSLFSLPDPDLQRSIPGLSVFYFWMIVPYLVGLYFLFRNIRASENKFVFILAVLAPIPASLAPDPFSTQRALPALLPLSLIIILGLDRLIFKKPLTLILLFPLLILSLFFLWRSYFLFLPKERARIWGYGFRELSEEIIRRPTEKFVIDEARIKPAYIELLFFLKYPPEKLHEAVEKSIKDNYYANPPFNSRYEFANIQTRGIIWEEDVYKNQILVGDKLAVSKEQATAHFLERVFEIRDPLGEIVFQGLRTNPVKKCLAYRDKRCDGVR